MFQKIKQIPVIFWIAAAIVLVLGGVGGFLFFRSDSTTPFAGGVTVSRIEGPSTQSGGQTVTKPGAQSLSVTLSQGQPAALASAGQSAFAQAPISGEPLTPQEIEKILARLAALPDQPGLQSEFLIAQQPIPPPQTGETIPEIFPPKQEPVSAPETASGPLQVLRYAPEGEIPIAPFVSITFNQPMVPLATLEQLSTAELPVRMEPALPGTWRWLGTKTLTFEYDSTHIDRLPKATIYQLSVPAGTQSMTGGVLTEEVVWSFSTPPPKITSQYPIDIPQPLEPLIFIAFDQRIDPAAVLEKIQISAGNQPVQIILASEEEIQQNIQIHSLVKNTLEGRWLAFKAAQPLPGDTQVTVTVEPGTPSAEGPLTTSEAQSFSFRTYASLQIVELCCSWGWDLWHHLTPFSIRFYN